MQCMLLGILICVQTYKVFKNLISLHLKNVQLVCAQFAVHFINQNTFCNSKKQPIVWLFFIYPTTRGLPHIDHINHIVHIPYFPTLTTFSV